MDTAQYNHYTLYNSHNTSHQFLISAENKFPSTTHPWPCPCTHLAALRASACRLWLLRRGVASMPEGGASAGRSSVSPLTAPADSSAPRSRFTACTALAAAPLLTSSFSGVNPELRQSSTANVIRAPVGASGSGGWGGSDGGGSAGGSRASGLTGNGLSSPVDFRDRATTQLHTEW